MSTFSILVLSMFFGNIFVYFEFEGQTTISKDTRTMVFIVLGVIAAIGIGFFVILRPARSESGELADTTTTGPITALTDSLRLFATRDMILLSVTFLYTGNRIGIYHIGCIYFLIFLKYCETKRHDSTFSSMTSTTLERCGVYLN